MRDVFCFGMRRRVAGLAAALDERTQVARAVLDLMVGKIGFSYEPIQAFPTRQGCTPESYELVATFISV